MKLSDHIQFIADVAWARALEAAEKQGYKLGAKPARPDNEEELKHTLEVGLRGVIKGLESEPKPTEFKSAEPAQK